MKKLKIVFILLASLLIACEDKEGQSTPEENGVALPRKEMRAVWMATVDRIDWPASTSSAESQKQQYINYLETFAQYNVNTVIVQIRPMADAFYPSSFEPWSQYITGTQGKDPGYDVLQFMVDEAHKRGIEFHAWINPYRVSSNAPAFNPADGHIAKAHPEWTMTYNKLLIFRPALPEVREHFLKVVDEIITKYDVDGIHFDDYFYPYPSAGFTLDDQADFEKYGSGYASIEDFRRGNVNKAIEGVSDLIKRKRPDILFSISPYPVWRNKSADPLGSSTSSSLTNYDDLYADIRLWCEKGWIDYVVPQLYPSTENVAENFITLADWWPKNTFNVPVLAGLGFYRFGVAAEGAIYQDPLELEMQFFYARRQKKIAGSVLYNANAFTANRLNILATLGKMYSEPALVPFMGRKTLADPNPVAIQINSNLLTWTASGSGVRYAIYKVEEGKVTLAGVTTENTYQLTADGDYMVSVVNKDNTESTLSNTITYKQ